MRDRAALFTVQFIDAPIGFMHALAGSSLPGAAYALAIRLGGVGTPLATSRVRTMPCALPL